jgi:hypothetical protein
VRTNFDARRVVRTYFDARRMVPVLIVMC